MMPAVAAPAPGVAAGAPTPSSPPAPVAAGSGGFGSFSGGSLYVGDLDPDVNEPLLFDIFNAVGNVASIRICRDNATRRSLGYGYVNFHNTADAERALDALNFHVIKNRPCRIMWQQRDPTLRKSGVGNIFVKNLDPTIDNKALLDTFSVFGSILSCKVAYDAAGKSKGYGFVHFERAASAEEAIAKVNDKKIGAQVVVVQPFVRRMERKGATDWTNVYCKQFPLEWDEGKLRELFAPFGTITSAIVMRDAENHSRGFGFVNFEKSEAAKEAVEAMNEKAAAGAERPLYVARAQKKNERQRELRDRAYKVQLEMLQRYAGCNLYIKNLDDDVTDDKLREAFTEHGTITSARVARDIKGLTRGFGYVCYTTQESAAKAIEAMNGKMWGSRPLYVALHQRREDRLRQLHAARTGRAGFMGPQPYGMGMGGPVFFPGAGGMPLPHGYTMQAPMVGAPHQMAFARPPYAGGMAYPMGAGAQRGRGPRRNFPNPAARAGPRAPNYRYQPGVRNPREGPAPVVGGGMPASQSLMPMPMAPMPTAAAAPAVALAPAPLPGGMEPLTPEALASASEKDQKNMIGERLYPLIQAGAFPVLAGKITGMLLEMDNAELLNLLETPVQLQAKITEAIQVLEAHNAEVGPPGQ